MEFPHLRTHNVRLTVALEQSRQHVTAHEPGDRQRLVRDSQMLPCGTSVRVVFACSRHRVLPIVPGKIAL